MEAGAISGLYGVAIGAVGGAAGYGIGKALPVRVSKGGDGGAMEAGATTQNGGGTATTAPKVAGATWVDQVGYVWDEVVVTGSAFALTATRVGASAASMVGAGLLSIMTAIPGDTPARLINDRTRWDKSPPSHPDYKAPKNWNGKTVKNPNRPNETGYPDADGDVWVPQNHKGTHNPHWDVQHPNGSHTPTYLPE